VTNDSARDFASVFERHFADVYGYVAYRLGGDAASAGEVTQEVFLAALRSWASYRGDGAPLTWLRAIARRKVVDHFRARTRRGARVDLDGLAARPAERVEATRHAALVAAVMRSLPDRDAELLEEKYLDRLSLREMAGRRGRTEKAVESALSRARERFRQSFRRLKSRQENEP
jgi:RNA polymerase sigma-70 factor (ECF subfamily)